MLDDKVLAFGEWLKENHTGRDKAVKVRDLRAWGSVRRVRGMVRQLRKKGWPICSCHEGYYVAESQQDLIDTVRMLQRMADGVESTAFSLLTTARFLGEWKGLAMALGGFSDGSGE